MTLMVSSHILAELDEYSTHMLMLREGRLVEFRALDRHEAREADGARRLRLRLAAPDPALAAKLAAMPGLKVLEAAPAQALLEWHGDDAGQAALLAGFVAAGLAVAEFGQSRENLHESYLRSIASGTGGAA